MYPRNSNKEYPTIKDSSNALSLLGVNDKPMFWPDIDLYFKRDIDNAKRLVEAIVNSGGEFLKGAVLQRSSICLKSNISAQFYDQNEQKIISENYRDIIERHVLPLELLDEILTFASGAGLKIVLSVYDQEGLEFAQEHGAIAIKIPSSNITHKRLIENVAQSDTAIVIDTGRASFDEIVQAYDWVKSKNAENKLIIQHSPPGPPAVSQRYHMNMLKYIKDYFDITVGLSDHHLDLNMFPIAIALGAKVIEKGVVLNKEKSDIDLSHALCSSRIGEALNLISDTYNSLGNNLRPNGELPEEHIDRMCLIAKHNIPANSIISEDMLDFSFPPLGISADKIDNIIGIESKAFIPKGAPILSKHIGK